MIFGDLVGLKLPVELKEGIALITKFLILKLPNICFTDEGKPRKNLTQETCPDRGPNPGHFVIGAHATACSTVVD